MKYLGITQTHHGSSAAVYDGERLVACNEERVNRVKWSSGFPNQSIDWCLNELGLAIQDIDAVGFYMTSSNYLSSARSSHTDVWRFYPEALYTVMSELLQRARPEAAPGVRHIRESVHFFDGKALELYFIDHHLAHAAASFLLSGFERAAILCLDGTGDGCSLSVSRGVGTEIEFLYRQPFPHSLGQFYATFTQFLGFEPNADEYKMMGLAAYGNPEVYAEKVRRLIRLHDDGSFELDMRYFAFHMVTERFKYNSRFVELFGLPPNQQVEDVPQGYCDLAAAVQRVTEDVVLHIATCVKRLTAEDNLCYGGGVALNCLANGRILQQSGFRDVYIPPNPGDGGLAIGSCAYLLHTLKGARRAFVYDHDYLGPAYSADEIRTLLRDNGLSYEEPANIAEAVAKRLAASKVVGRFDGRQEFGPRALGNRSILADPRSSATKALLNRKIKYREPFRPFAPSSTQDRVGELFQMRPQAVKATAPESFMLATVPVRDQWRAQLQAVTHHDGTARLQTVFAEKNRKYHDVIQAFGRETGVPAVLNTSFNVRGEPMVLSPQDALRCFYSTGMDTLAIGPYLLDKRPAHA